MIRPGLCSVTLRALEPSAVVELAAAAGLEAIEWGGDVHVPPGDVERAGQVRALTEGAGLAVASYGSYLRCEGPAAAVEQETRAVLASAAALGAPRVRVWAGTAGSADAAPDAREDVVRNLRRACELAAAQGIELGLEFHGGTLTDEVGSTLRLLEEVDHPALTTYWQPHQDMPAPEAIDTLRRVLDRVSTVHVFSWWPGSERLALSERSDLWREAFATLAAHGGDHDALLEFVPGDDPALLAREAGTLRELLAVS
ncbi:sugar phosphate isomerase/epimerase [Brachybacterium sp. NBEC-018]|uniref:sugar phosphate isomerase/epimerase family protein n=1 Tax=Brachybacterium sp. NBEC-018 TaxID=2996004 RepID=UPI002175055D|nr:sugar phosphate isomerase/epimerase [Brachybacterium sp. NBEC-018]UVY84983.1 sugar phosphate isomerase/epimerase [Brachybacterium sp. NBEC-018]